MNCPHCGKPIQSQRQVAQPNASMTPLLWVIFGITAATLGLILYSQVMPQWAVARESQGKADIAKNEASAIGRLRTIGTAQATFESAKGRFGAWNEIVNEGLITPDLTKDGYEFKVSLTASGFEAVATPVKYNSTGRRSFYISSDYVIRYADNFGSEADKTDDPL